MIKDGIFSSQFKKTQFQSQNKNNLTSKPLKIYFYMLCVQHKSLNWVQYWLTCTCLASQGQACFLLQIQWRCLSGSFPQDKLDFWSGIKYSWRLSPWPTIYRSKNLEVLIEGSVFKSLDLGHYISWSFFSPENVIQERHQWPDSTVQSHQWAAIDGSTCEEMFLLRIMHSHQCTEHGAIFWE